VGKSDDRDTLMIDIGAIVKVDGACDHIFRTLVVWGADRIVDVGIVVRSPIAVISGDSARIVAVGHQADETSFGQQGSPLGELG
jgi:hypothetical protein